jgi:hypothetical protein
LEYRCDAGRGDDDDVAFATASSHDGATASGVSIQLCRKVKKLKLLEFTGGCRMSWQFTKVGLNGT